MIEFRAPELSDKSWVKERLSKKDNLTCEYSFSNIFSYTEKMKLLIADVNGYLVTKCYIDDVIGYCYPVGDGNIRDVLMLVINDMKQEDKACFLFGVNENDKAELETLFPESFDFELDRDGFDYIYLSSDLISLSGKKYQPKRNHISFFKKNYNWSYESMSAENVGDCYNMNIEWLEKSGSIYSEDLSSELKIIRKVFENFEALGCRGGVIRIDGKVVAFAMGEEINKDTFCVHFEKAFSDIRGSYAMINQQFVENELSAYKYIDREDDLGLENLRKAKLSYNPIRLPEKYEVWLRKC